MQLSERHVSIVNSLYMMNLPLAKGDDDQRRQLTKKIAEQICFEFGSNWGTKASSPTNPQSKDAIAFREPGKLTSWDWQNGTTREPQVHVGQEGENITGQFFIEVQPVNHLSSVPDNGDEEEDELVAILKQIADTQQTIMENQVRLSQAIQLLIDKPAPDINIPPVKFPEYKASTFFGTITLKPQV